MTALPTHRAEDWRYSDLDALGGLWPLPDTDGIALRAFAETRLLEIAFD